MPVNAMRAWRSVAGLAWLCSAGAAVAQAARTVEVATEFATSSDVQLWQTTVDEKFERGAGSDVTISAVGGGYAIDYQPASFDFHGRATRLRRENLAVQGALRQTVSPTLTLLAGAGAYDGFTNYRSVWLDEYFRQQYAAATSLQGYRVAHPHGFNGSAGARWEYLPASGFAQFNVAWLSDRVAPGYEVDFDGLHRGPDTLNTAAAELQLENIATPRLRTLVTLRAVKTSTREVRLGAELAANCAVGEAWALRAAAGGTRERPTFTAGYASLAIERAVAEGLFLAVSGRVYHDTGEIENALMFTSAAPALTSYQVGLALRHESDRWSWRVAVTPILTRSAPTNPFTDFFQHLYRDRDWTLVQAAVAVAF